MRLIHSGPAERKSRGFRCPLTGVYHISSCRAFQPFRVSLNRSLGDFRALDMLVNYIYYLFLSTFNGLSIQSNLKGGPIKVSTDVLAGGWS